MRQEMCNSLSENHNSESQDTNRKEQKVSYCLSLNICIKIEKIISLSEMGVKCFF